MRAAIVLAAVLLGPTAAPPPSGPAVWPQFRLHAGGNAVVGGTLTASWRITTAGGFSSSPTFTSGTLYAANNAGELFALDPRTGTIRWKYRVANPLMSAPIVYGDLVIVGEGNENSPDGSSPSHPIRVGNPPSALFALDRRTGRLVWRVPLRGTGMPTPAVVDGVLLHHDGSGMLLALDPLTGALQYSRNLQSIASMSAIIPIAAGAFITAGVDPNAVWALRANGRRTIWRTFFSRVASGIGDCPAVTDERAVYCDYVMPPSAATPVQTERSAQNRAYALDIRTGKKLWDVQLDAGQLPKRNEAAIPLFAQGTLYVGSAIAGAVRGLEPRTGRVLWTAHTHGPVKGGIVDVDGVLYCGDSDGYLWAINAKSGRVIGKKRMGTPFNVGSPTVVGQTLFIGSRGGTFAATPLAAIRSARD